MGVVAAAAQLWQAAGSFAIQIAAAWLLGGAGLALVSLCLGIIVVATAITGGVVGDSLTVLNRRDASIRGGLNAWLLLLIAVGALGGAVGLGFSGVLDWAGTPAFALACGAFIVEDVLRRVHVATLTVGKLFAIDTVALLVTLGVVAFAELTTGASLTAFLAALFGGQVAGAVTAWWLLPAPERFLGRPVWSSMRVVGSFGLWRGAQVALTPATQTGFRLAILTTTGAFALGQLEAGRIYVAPAVLTVQGYGSYLFARYADQRHASTSSLVDIATRAARRLTLVTVVFGALAVACLPWLGPLVSGPRFQIDRVVILGWVAVAAATAWLQPFASLAATRGAQRRVFLVRTVDATLSPCITWLALSATSVAARWAPLVVAAGLLVAGTLVRLLALRPLIRSEEAGVGGTAANVGGVGGRRSRHGLRSRRNRMSETSKQDRERTEPDA